MEIITKILVLTIFSLVLQSNSETTDTHSKSNGISASKDITIENSARTCGCTDGILKNSDVKTSPSELSYETQRRLEKHKNHHKLRHLSNRKKREVPEENHEYTSLRKGDPDSQIIPSEWILKYCFKQTPLEHFMKNKMQTCEPKGLDFSCMFSLETEEDSLESRFDRLDDDELQVPLKQAVAVCRQRHERQSTLHEETQLAEKFSEDQPKQADDSNETAQRVNFVDPVILNRVLKDLDRDAFNLTVATPTPQEREYKPKRRARRIQSHRRHRFYRRTQRSVSTVDSSPKFTKDTKDKNAAQLRNKRAVDYSDLFDPLTEYEDQGRPMIKIDRNPTQNEEIGPEKPIEIRITLDKNAKEGLVKYERDSKIQEQDEELPQVWIGPNDVNGRSGVNEHVSFTEEENQNSETNEHTDMSSCIAKEVIKVTKSTKICLDETSIQNTCLNEFISGILTHTHPFVKETKRTSFTYREEQT